MYRRCRNTVRNRHIQLEEFNTKQGLRQGSVLIPTWNILLVDDVIKKVWPLVKNLEFGYIAITEYAFAGDMAIFAKKWEKPISKYRNVSTLLGSAIKRRFS